MKLDHTQKSTINRLYNQEKKSISEIAKIIGCDKTIVTRYINYNPDEKKIIKKREKQFYKCKCNKCGVSFRTTEEKPICPVCKSKDIFIKKIPKS